MNNSTRDVFPFIVIVIVGFVIITLFGVVSYLEDKEIIELNKQSNEQCFPYVTVYADPNKGFVICESPNGRILKQWSKENQEKK
jgi:hypothetical protein